MSRMMASHRCARGMTLLELLISLAIIGTIGVLLASTTQLGQRVWEQSQSIGVSAASPQNVLRRQLSVMRDISLPATGTQARALAFEGAPDRLRFIAPAPSLAGTPGPVLQRFALRDGELVLDVWPGLGLEAFNSPGDPSETLFLGQAENLRLFYFGAPSGGAPRWHNAWASQLILPALIRVELADQPPLFIAPQIGRIVAAP